MTDKTQEPVAWADLNALTEQFNSVNCGTAYRLPGEGRQPLYTSPPAQQQEPVAAFGPVAKRRIFDYIRGAYDLGYNDARNARTVPGDSAPGYKGRDVEADHGGALLHALEAITSPPASKPWAGLTDEMVVAAARMLSDRQAAECNVDCGDMWKMHGNDFIEDARAALEAAHGIKGNA